MPLNDWSDTIVIADLNDEPQFSEDMDALTRRIDDAPGQSPDVILKMANVTYMNSTNISQLLKVRKKVLDRNGRLKLCSLSDRVWSVMLATGLDNIFDFNEDISTSLAALQLLE